MSGCRPGFNVAGYTYVIVFHIIDCVIIKPESKKFLEV